MQTTVVLPDELFHRAKAKAAREGRSLSSLIEDALRRELDEQPRERVVLPTFGGGGLQPGVDLDSNAALQDLLDEDDPFIQSLRKLGRG